MDRLRFANKLLTLATDYETKKIEYKNAVTDYAKKQIDDSYKIFQTLEELGEISYNLLSECNRITDQYDSMISEIVRLDFEEEEESEGHPNDWN